MHSPSPLRPPSPPVSPRALGLPRALSRGPSAHALLVALALTRGYDPGAGGLGLFWCRMGDVSYRLGTLSGDSYFTRYEWNADGAVHLYVPTVAREKDGASPFINKSGQAEF
jgi:hypothetical protein